MTVHFLGETLTPGTLVFLLVALAIAAGFEFVNGFHDTANAVATVIYTRSLRPTTAVIWSGVCNFLGVHLGGIAVAFSIVHLLPVDLLVSIGTRTGMAMVLALLIGAILWNLGTWYRGLPASSSHTLIGAILGVGLANSLLPGHSFGSGVNWPKAAEVGLSLLISPMVGFAASALLLLIAKRLLRDQRLFEPPDPHATPPRWIRGLLIVTSTGVSLAHGSNDGQKGVGLIMLILIGLLPTQHALNMDLREAPIRTTIAAVQRTSEMLGRLPSERVVPFVADRSRAPTSPRPPETGTVASVRAQLDQVAVVLGGKTGMADVPVSARWQVRTDVLRLNDELAAVAASHDLELTNEDRDLVKETRKQLRGLIDYAPSWVIVMVALALGLGTTVGWKRIVVTVGEKIGKRHLTYAQGAAAELVAMSTIGIADHFGLPVSTTHVLSSGVAGTMAANRSGLQVGTVRDILLAWVLTLPAAMLLSATLFLLFRWVL